MDLGKLLDLLESQMLFFPCLSTLARDDPYEGFLGETTIAEFRQRNDMDDQSKATILRSHQQAMERLCVSCWHMNDHESAAMWSLYVRGGEGLAIQTTIQQLKQSFAGTKTSVYLGQVRYINHQVDKIGWDNVFYPALHKRASFEHERELRAIVFPNSSAVHDGGFRVEVRIPDLIERLVVAPAQPGWFAAMIERIVRRLGYDFPVERSPLMDRPIY